MQVFLTILFFAILSLSDNQETETAKTNNDHNLLETDRSISDSTKGERGTEFTQSTHAETVTSAKTSEQGSAGSISESTKGETGTEFTQSTDSETKSSERTSKKVTDGSF